MYKLQGYPGGQYQELWVRSIACMKDAAGFAPMLDPLSHFLLSNHASAISAIVNEYATCRDKFAALCWLYILPTMRTILYCFVFATGVAHFQKFHTVLILLPMVHYNGVTSQILLKRHDLKANKPSLTLNQCHNLPKSRLQLGP